MMAGCVRRRKMYIKMDGSLKVKPKHIDLHLVAGCKTGNESHLLYVSGLDMYQIKTSKYMYQKSIVVNVTSRTKRVFLMVNLFLFTLML